MANNELRPADRLILVMLAEIYESLNIGGEIDPTLVREAVYKGRLWGLQQEYPGIFDADEEDPSDVSRVSDILDMWWHLERAYEQLSDADKAEVDKAVTPLSVRFAGFDNHEGSTLSIARFLIERLDRYPDFKGRELDTHSPVLEGYVRMLATYRPIHKASATRQDGLTKDEIIAVVNARRHPDWRE